MPQISNLKAQKNKKRVNVFLDGEYATSLDLATVAKLNLKKGMDISAKDLADLVRKHHFEKLFNKTLRFLSYRPRSKNEIRSYLEKKWKSEIEKKEYKKLIDQVLEKLQNQDLIDDLEFCRWWIKQRLEFRPKGKNLLKKELFQKGIDRTLIKKSLDSYDELDAALRAADKRKRSLKDLTDTEVRKKLTSFLKNRGFVWETIKKVVDESLSQE